MSDDGPSKMDITEHKAMYEAFWNWTIRTCVFVAIVLLLMLIFLV